MQENAKTIFHNLTELEPPQRLLGGIVMRIILERQRHAWVRVMVWTAGTMGALAGLVPAFHYAGQELAQSGFYQYLSLLFSDGGVLLANSWREFALSLAESLPLMGITFVLAALFVLLGSIRLIARDMKTAFLSVQLR